MLDFLDIATKVKQGILEVYPKFIIKKSKDLMTKGGDFYAVWNESDGVWSTQEWDVFDIVDSEIDKYCLSNSDKFSNYTVSKKYMRDSDSGAIDRWHKYIQKQMPSNHYVNLDENIVFGNSKTNKENYASKKVDYNLAEGNIDCYDTLMSILYEPDERHKLEWIVGSIVCGDSKKLQKFVVLYGTAGSGKSTWLNIVYKLFEPYTATFDAKSLGNPNSVFALEPFKDNPLVAIQHDGDLSKIEDNARLNSLISHESLNVNEKFKSLYEMKFNSMLLIGTNKPVKITDAKSGLLRRLIDVQPSGNTVEFKEYNRLISGVNFELGAIAYHCLQVYKENPEYYKNYVPLSMINATNDFYNFITEYYFDLVQNDPIQLKAVWNMYNDYVLDSKMQYSMNKRSFKEELKNYYEEYLEQGRIDGKNCRNVFKGFKKTIFDSQNENDSKVDKWIKLKKCKSIFDTDCENCIAQYATKDGKPKKKWENVETKLKNIDTSKLHFVKVPLNHIVIDFDLCDENGNKSLEKNIEEANNWPKTYVECSKSGSGLHLHYIYDGNPEELSSIYSEKIEIKVFKGGASLRRLLSKCNDLPISHISSGLPLKKERGKKMINGTSIQSERALRTLIIRNLRKEIHDYTKPSIEFIKKILDDAYESGLTYNVEDMRGDIIKFAAHSSHNAKYCIKMVNEMKFASKNEIEAMEFNVGEYVFFDIEIFPNLFVICFKVHHKDNVIALINPSSDEVRKLLDLPLIGFNNRDYDNHILWYASQGYSIKMLYDISQSIINEGNGKNLNAYNISYADVYEFAKKKQSLKKWEIELGIKHNELGLPWNKPVDKSLWPKVAEYCKDDVRATEAVFDNRHGDFIVKQVLAKMAGGCVNDSTTQLTNKIIFGNNKSPQNEFNYRNMGNEDEITHYLFEDEWATFNDKNQPIFKGYTYKKGVSSYRGEEPGEGGYVYAEPGCYANVALLDIASMHPSSIEAEELFGPYTKRFCDLKYGRITLKHINQMIENGAKEEDIEKEIENAKNTLFDGDLSEFLDNREDLAALPDAFKLVINKVYGLTKASFSNPFKDDRNIDNIVAKRGALFMINLKYYVQNLGYHVIHIKTDSIKIPNADEFIINKVMEYGKAYGYTFEHEATYERIVLVNDAVYIAKDAKDGHWSPTGKEFAVPYVFKTLFGNPNDINIDDMSITFSSKGSIYLDMNNDLEDDSELVKKRDKLIKKQKEEQNPELDLEIQKLNEEISKLHKYVFVGKVGLFSPVIGIPGGRLVVTQDNEKFNYAPGSKGYRWLETASLIDTKNVDKIDRSYFENLVISAKEHIGQFVDYETLIDDDFSLFYDCGVLGLPFH